MPLPIRRSNLIYAIFFVKKRFNFPKSERALYPSKGEMEIKISIVQFLFKTDWKILSDSLNALSGIESKKIDSSHELLKVMSNDQNCLIIANISSRDDLIQLATFMKMSKMSARSNITKIVVVNSTDNKHYEKAISKLANVEILESTVNVRALSFKMNFWMKAMRGQARKLLQDGQKADQAVEAAATEAKSLNSLSALECESDFWILARESDCKKIISRWMVKLMGPGPYVGNWNEVPDKANTWIFHIKKSFRETLVAGDGHWFYRGDQKPEFNWSENKWMFTGEDIELFFQDTKVHSRLKISNKVLSLAANSLFAKSKESIILDSFSKDLVFKHEAELIKDKTIDLDNEGDLGGHLQGKVKDQEVAGERLDAKSKNAESIKPSEEKHKKAKETAGSFENLRGKIKSDTNTAANGEKREDEVLKKSHTEGLEQSREKLKIEPVLEDKKTPESKHAHSVDSLENLKGIFHNEEALEDQDARASYKKTNPSIPFEKLKGKLNSTPKTQDLDNHETSAEVRGDNPSLGVRKNRTPDAPVTENRKTHSQNNEQMRSNWAGKLKQKGNEADKKESHRQHNEQIESMWGGEIESSNKKEKSEKKNQASVQINEKEDSGLKGKNDKTDHLKSHWGSKLQSDGAISESDSATGPGNEHLPAGTKLDQKKTDHEHETYYRGRHLNKQYAADDTNKNQYRSEIEVNDEGRSTTDHLSSHYGTKKSASENQNEDSVSQKGLTEIDRLKSHMVGLKKDSSQSEKLNTHSEINKKIPARKSTNNDVNLDDLLDIEDEIEAALDLPEYEQLENVLPFAKTIPEDDAAIAKLTESGVIHSFLVQAEHRYKCFLNDYFENNAIFVCEGEGLKNSENVLLDISLKYNGKTSLVNCEGRVMSIDQNGDGGFFVTVEVSTENSQLFDNLLTHLQSRQEDIDVFIKMVKGL